MKLYWIDLETTGLDPVRDAILEVAVSEAEFDDPFNAKLMYHAVLPLPSVELSAVIIAMHTSNGLLHECTDPELLDACAAGLMRVEDDLLAFIPEIADKEERPILAGSSVHFDLSFVRVHWPRLAARLSHRCYDVTALKLFARSMGMPKLAKGEAHRAVQDIEESIAHGRACMQWLATNLAREAPR